MLMHIYIYECYKAWRADLLVEGCHVGIPDEGLGPLVQLMNPVAFSNYNLKYRIDS